MERMTSHEAIEELLGAYALDAVDPDEARQVELHLQTCPRCREEVRSHREVVGLLANAGQEAPAGLWDRVVAGIHDPGAESPVPALRVVRPPGSDAGRNDARSGAGVLRSRRVL